MTRSLASRFNNLFMAAEQAKVRNMRVLGLLAISLLASGVSARAVPVNYAGMIYQQCGSTWYARQGSQFVVVNPPRRSMPGNARSPRVR
jgi:hypothetical protein